jgi:hypothetical protein
MQTTEGAHAGIQVGERDKLRKVLWDKSSELSIFNVERNSYSSLLNPLSSW